MTVNRFLEASPVPRQRPFGSGSRPAAGTMSLGQWATPMAVADRALIVLIENGGINLGIPELVDKLLDQVPGRSLLPEAVIRQAAATIEQAIKDAVDTLLESADLALNQYGAARGSIYGDVTVLRDGTATYDDLKARLTQLSRAGKAIDLIILTHGSETAISVGSGINAARIRELKSELGGPLGIRAVYQMNCWGSRLNQAWLDAGAKASAGSVGINYLPEPTNHFFWKNWQAGQSFEDAATNAYQQTIRTMNAVIRGVVSALPIPGSSILASQLDVAHLDFVVSSAPVIAGTKTVTVTTDPPAASTGQSLLMSLPASALEAIVEGPPPGAAGRPRRTVSATGRAFITRWEQPSGAPAVADAEIHRRIEAAERALEDAVTAPLAQHQVDALASVVCSIGTEAFRASTLLRLVNERKDSEVPDEIRKWVLVRRPEGTVPDPRLQARRNEEAAGFAQASVPGTAMSLDTWARPFNPILVEAVGWGLAAAGMVQSGIQAGAGTFDLTYDKAERMLTPAARLAMPGAPAVTQTYRRRFLWVPQFRVGTAHAVVDVVWSGNAYGEMSSVVFERVLSQSSDWTQSDFRCRVTVQSRVPASRDPREWPLTFRYEGGYDPTGNGKYEFQGEIELNAFGGIRWIQPHNVVSRSLIDGLLNGEGSDWVQRGTDVWPAKPSIPAEQEAYLRQHSPGSGN